MICDFVLIFSQMQRFSTADGAAAISVLDCRCRKNMSTCHPQLTDFALRWNVIPVDQVHTVALSHPFRFAIYLQ